MKYILILLTVLFALNAQSAGGASSAPDASASAPSPEVVALRAQLETTKQFQDSFMSMAQWTLGSAIAVALALGAFAWHTNKTNYERDRESIQRESKTLATELRVELRAEIQSESKKVEDGLAAREKSIRESVEKALTQRLSALTAKIKDVESEALDLKEASIEKDAEASLANGDHKWAVRKYCELLENHVRRDMDEYFAADVLDKLRSIAKKPEAVLDAEAVTLAVKTLSELPKRHQAACEPLIVLFKRKLA